MCSHCHNCRGKKKNISGLYSGKALFPGGISEPITINFMKDGSMEVIGNLQYPSSGSNLYGPDLETSQIGQWKKKCDGTIMTGLIERRQAGPEGGLPAAFGYTQADIPSLPNYLIVASAELTLDQNCLKGPFFSGFGDASFTVQNGPPLLPFSQIIQGTLELYIQPINDLFEAIPK